MIASKYAYQVGYPRDNRTDKLTDEIKLHEFHNLLKKFKIHTTLRERVESEHIYDQVQMGGRTTLSKTEI